LESAYDKSEIEDILEAVMPVMLANGSIDETRSLNIREV